jgi:hypothetical protein
MSRTTLSDQICSSLARFRLHFSLLIFSSSSSFDLDGSRHYDTLSAGREKRDEPKEWLRMNLIKGEREREKILSLAVKIKKERMNINGQSNSLNDDSLVMGDLLFKKEGTHTQHTQAGGQQPRVNSSKVTKSP